MTSFASDFTVICHFPGNFPIPSKWSGNSFLRSAVLQIDAVASQGSGGPDPFVICCLSGAMLRVCNGFLKHIAQFIMMTSSFLDAGRTRMAGSSVSTTCTTECVEHGVCYHGASNWSKCPVLHVVVSWYHCRQIGEHWSVRVHWVFHSS